MPGVRSKRLQRRGFNFECKRFVKGLISEAAFRRSECMKNTILSTLFKSLCSLAFLGGAAQVSHAQIVTSQLYSPNTVRWLIQQPQVNAPRLPNSFQTQPYDFNLGLQYLSLVTVSAGGCVQTGGKGLT